MLAEGGVALIDLRDADRFAEGHIHGARNVPLAELVSRGRGLREPVIVYDADGAVVREYIAALRETIGELELFVLDRGVEAWIAQGRPLEH